MPLPILESIAPVFLIVALGALLRLGDFVSARMLADINRLSYWVGLPCLTFVSIATAPLALGPALGLFLTVLLATLMGGTLAWFGAARCGVGPAARGTFVQAAFRGNLAFIGLPVIVYAMPGNVAVKSATVMAFAPTVALYSLASVLVLQASRGGDGHGGARALWRSVLTNPQLLACALGLTAALAGLHLSPALTRSLEALGNMALPLALLGIGGALPGVHLHGRVGPALAAALLKTALLPLLGAGLAVAFALSPEHTRAALVLLATPTAAASYILAREFGGDESLATGAILLSTLLSAPALALVLILG